MKRIGVTVAAACSPLHSSAAVDTTTTSSTSGNNSSSVMTSLARISPVLACVVMQCLDQSSYAAVARCSRHWSVVSRLPAATPRFVKFRGCWRDVDFARLTHLRPRHLQVVPDLTDRTCGLSADLDHKCCDRRRILPLLRTPAVCELVRTLRLSISARESAETVGEYVAALAAMTDVTELQLHMEVPGDGVPLRAHTTTVADLVAARRASLVRLAISGATFAIGDAPRTIAAFAECRALRHLSLTLWSDWKLHYRAWTNLSRAAPRLVGLRLVGPNAVTLAGFVAAVRGAVDPWYDPNVAAEHVDDAAAADNDGKTSGASPPERAFMQLHSLEIQSAAAEISLAPMPNLVRLAVIGGKRTKTTPVAAAAEVPSAAADADAADASQSEASPAAQRFSHVALDDREYRRVVPSSASDAVGLVNVVPARDDPRRQYVSWTSLRELQLDAAELAGDELDRLPALKALTLGARVVMCHPFAWSLTRGWQLRRRAAYLGRTVEQQQAVEAQTRSSAAADRVAGLDVIATADEPALPYCLASICVATPELIGAISRLGVAHATQSLTLWA